MIKNLADVAPDMVAYEQIPLGATLVLPWARRIEGEYRITAWINEGAEVPLSSIEDGRRVYIAVPSMRSDYRRLAYLPNVWGEAARTFARAWIDDFNIKRPLLSAVPYEGWFVVPGCGPENPWPLPCYQVAIIKSRTADVVPGISVRYWWQDENGVLRHADLEDWGSIPPGEVVYVCARYLEAGTPWDTYPDRVAYYPVVWDQTNADAIAADCSARTSLREGSTVGEFLTGRYLDNVPRRKPEWVFLTGVGVTLLLAYVVGVMGRTLYHDWEGVGVLIAGMVVSWRWFLQTEPDPELRRRKMDHYRFSLNFFFTAVQALLLLVGGKWREAKWLLLFGGSAAVTARDHQRMNQHEAERKQRMR